MQNLSVSIYKNSKKNLQNIRRISALINRTLNEFENYGIGRQDKSERMITSLYKLMNVVKTIIPIERELLHKISANKNAVIQNNTKFQ